MAETSGASEAIASLTETEIQLTSEMLTSILETEVTPHLHFTGLNRVSRDVLRGEMKRIELATNVKELFRAVDSAHFRWGSINVFDNIAVSYEPLRDGTKRDVCVHFHVNEKKPSKQFGVFTSETSVPEVTASLNNLFSSRYNISGKYMPPATRTHGFSLSAISNVPWFGRTAEYYTGLRREDRSMNLAEAEKIEEVKITHSDIERDVNQQIIVGIQRRNTAARDLYELPWALQLLLGENYKLYAAHQYHRISEEHHYHPFLFSLYPLPVRGASFFVRNELSVDPNVGIPLLRSDLQCTKQWLLHPFMVLSWGLRLGAAISSGTVPVNDRLYLGWRHVRGFKNIGPSTDDVVGDRVARYAATGGNALWASTLSLNFPVPLIPHNGLLAMHLFANAGNCDYFHGIRDYSNKFFNFFKNASCSVGCGLIVTQVPFFGVMPSGRFEFNVSHSVVFNDSEITFAIPRPGLFDRWRFGLVWSSNVSD